MAGNCQLSCKIVHKLRIYTLLKSCLAYSKLRLYLAKDLDDGSSEFQTPFLFFLHNPAFEIKVGEFRLLHDGNETIDMLIDLNWNG
jgi:hypothetical protein